MRTTGVGPAHEGEEERNRERRHEGRGRSVNSWLRCRRLSATDHCARLDGVKHFRGSSALYAAQGSSAWNTTCGEVVEQCCRNCQFAADAGYSGRWSIPGLHEFLSAETWAWPLLVMFVLSWILASCETRLPVSPVSDPISMSSRTRGRFGCAFLVLPAHVLIIALSSSGLSAQ